MSELGPPLVCCRRCGTPMGRSWITVRTCGRCKRELRRGDRLADESRRVEQLDLLAASPPPGSRTAAPADEDRG